MNDDNDDEPRTNPTGSFALFRDEAHRVAGMLERIAFVERKRIDLYDRERIEKNEELSRELRTLGARFNRWPTLPAETVADERAELVPRLFHTLHEALALLERTPAMATLGKVPRP